MISVVILVLGIGSSYQKILEYKNMLINNHSSSFETKIGGY